MFCDLILKSRPVPTTTWFHIPHVELENAFACRRSLVSLICSIGLSKFHTCLTGAKVDCFENILVQTAGLRRVIRKLHHLQSVSQTLNTNTNGTMTHVGPLGLLNRVEVVVNDTVQVVCHNLGDLLELVQIEVTLFPKVSSRSHKLGKTDTCQVAHGNFIRCGVLHNFSTQVGALDGSEVLLVRLSVAVIFVEHVRSSGLYLGVQDGKPKLLSLDGLTSLALTLVLLVEGFEFITPAVGKSLALIGAHQGPIAI
mmetsp:Transcript_10323/g.17553  ORF Transcript_10323/g.17553 Transcript_10323/m.17553 type:complete len:254 (+) Transcript_10323:1928-2689(+)